MPWIIDYQTVLEQLREQKLRCLYHNSGAFGFTDDVITHTRGWVGPDDQTIRPESRGLVRSVPAPFETNLAELTARAWTTLLPGKVWVMPKSHWAYELEFGSRDWMPALLEKIGVDPGMLIARNNAAAIEFSPDDHRGFSTFVAQLLMMLLGSDFLLVFSGRQTICTVHSHKQIWWTSSDLAIIEGLDRLV
jgi:hypothetical protein